MSGYRKLKISSTWFLDRKTMFFNSSCFDLSKACDLHLKLVLPRVVGLFSTSHEIAAICVYCIYNYNCSCNYLDPKNHLGYN